MKTLFLNYLEKAMNAYLQQDEQSKLRLKKLAGKTLSVELLPMSWQFNCSFSSERVQVTMHDEIVPHTKIKGTPLQLCGVMLNKSKRKQFFAEDLQIEGDAELAQEVTELFDNIQIDWEEHLSQLIGDIPAFQVSRFAGNIKQWLQKAGSGVRQDVNDYLHEEAQCFPPREALHEFFDDIDTLRMDADRLEARFNHVKAQLEKEDEL